MLSSSTSFRVIWNCWILSPAIVDPATVILSDDSACPVVVIVVAPSRWESQDEDADAELGSSSSLIRLPGEKISHSQ